METWETHLILQDLLSLSVGWQGVYFEEKIQ